MSRFQRGSLFKLKRKSCPNVWVFRWYDCSTGKRIRRKKIIGNVTKLRNRGEAEKAVMALRSAINVEVGMPRSLCDLAVHYQLHELTRERKAFTTIESHRALFKRHIEPRWGHLQLSAVRTMQVEAWLDSLKLAPKSKAKLKSILSVLYNHAIRHEWIASYPRACAVCGSRTERFSSTRKRGVLTRCAAAPVGCSTVLRSARPVCAGVRAGDAPERKSARPRSSPA